MHELSITRAILAIVLKKAQEANAVRITQIDLQIGRLAGIVPECVDLQFAVLSKGTIAEKAVLSCEMLPLMLKCRVCDVTYGGDDAVRPCPQCADTAVDIVSGYELSVQSMEVE